MSTSSLVRGKWVVPGAADAVLIDGAILVQDGDISDVDTVLVDGEVVLRDGMPTRFDVREAGRELAESLDDEPYPVANAEMVAHLLPHLEAWYENWDIPALEPWIRYNSRS